MLEDGLPRAVHARLEREIGGRSALGAISVLEQRLFLGERLLRDNDVASMAASIEQRLPLVDSVLLEAVIARAGSASLPAGERARRCSGESACAGWTRRSSSAPSAASFSRSNGGFRQGLSSAIDETLRDEDAVRSAGLEPGAVGRLWRAFRDGAPGLYWSRVWAVYVLVRWCRRHGLRL